MQTSFLSVETRQSARKKMRLEQGKFLVSEDRLSNLPEPIVHDIVSRLPSRTAAWMSIVSKKWEYLIKSFPEISFDEREFEYKNDKENDKRLCQFMSKYSLCQTPILIQTIKLSTAFVRRSKINHQVDRCLDLVVPNEIRELVLKFRHSHQLPSSRCNCYSMPGKVFSLGKHLSVLELEGCRFGDLDAVDVPLLKIVSLSYVHICDDQLSKLVVACRSLESLLLQHCYGLRRLRILNSSLQRLVINYCGLLESFCLNCPLLQYLECKAIEVYDSGEILELSEFWTCCTALREIYLACVYLGAETFKCIFTVAPHVKSLTLRSCIVERTRNFYPRALKHLNLEDTYFPQLADGLISVESFVISIHANCHVPTTISSADYNIICSAIWNFFHLKSLSLQGDFPPSNESLDFILFICPHLQNLDLYYCRHLSYLKIVSWSLKTFSVKSGTGVQLEGEIDAPNLISFKLEGPLIRFSRVVVSHQLVAELHFRNCYDNSAPLKLSEFEHYVQMFNEARVLKLSNYFFECVFIPEAQVAVRSLYHLSETKVRASLRKKSYKQFLSQVLSLSLCHTSLLLSFEHSALPLSDGSSASLDLKFQDHQQGVIVIQGENHVCVRDHLYEISIQIFKGHNQVIRFLKYLLGKASQLKKLVVLFDAEVPTEIRSSMILKITALKIVSKTCEIVLC